MQAQALRATGGPRARPGRGDPARPGRHHPELRPGDGGAGADPARPADRLSRASGGRRRARGIAGADLARGQPRPARLPHASLPRLVARHRRDAHGGAEPPRPRARPQRERPLDDHLRGARLRLRAARLERARDLVAQAGALGMRYSRAAQGYVATALLPDRRLRRRRWRRPRSRAMRSSTCRPGRRRAWCSSATCRPRGRRCAGSSGWRCRPGPAGGQPTEADAIDWFMGCFPIRYEDGARRTAQRACWRRWRHASAGLDRRPRSGAMARVRCGCARVRERGHTFPCRLTPISISSAFSSR